MMKITKKGTLTVHPDGRIALQGWKFIHNGQEYETKRDRSHVVDPTDIPDPVLQDLMASVLLTSLAPWNGIVAKACPPPPQEIFPHDVEQKARALLRRF